MDCHYASGGKPSASYQANQTPDTCRNKHTVRRSQTGAVKVTPDRPIHTDGWVLISVWSEALRLWNTPSMSVSFAPPLLLGCTISHAAETGICHREQDRLYGNGRPGATGNHPVLVDCFCGVHTEEVEDTKTHLPLKPSFHWARRDVYRQNYICGIWL